MSNFTHYGLYFSPAATQRAQEKAKQPPYQGAFEALQAPLPADDPIAQAVQAGLRYRLLAAPDAALTARTLLLEQGNEPDLQAYPTYQQACAALVATGQAFEMIRDTLSTDVQRGWLHVYNEHLETQRNQQAGATSLLDRIWRTTLEIAGGVVLERDEVYTLGLDDFRQIVNQHIHPEGYFPDIVKQGGSDGLVQQVLAAKGLALAAEAANQQGNNLWDHELRGISAKTSAIYAAAYYEYRDQWSWGPPPDEGENATFYQENAAFLEILNPHLPPEVLRSTLDDLRPLWDPYGGGLTTLTHARPARRGLLGGLFG